MELGKNNSGHGVGGSMIHYAGYAPRFHPSDFETRTRDGVGFDWPLSYWDLKPHYERVERELPVAGQDWPWGEPHSYPHGPHPISGAAERAWAGARAYGIEMRVGPVAIANGVFGNRPHCIYRGFCLQGCKVNAKASPLVTHVPDAFEHGVEIRADSMVVRIELDAGSRHVTGVTYVHGGRERFQRAVAVAVCGYAIESPRLLLNSASKRFPDGLGNNADQVGRYVMVQGATQVAGRFPELLRMYKAPPPEVSSEDFYETDESRGFARGFSIQTVGPLPIGWAEHVLADGHRGTALREYMRDYNHWSVLGSLCELLPLPENRVTLAEEKGRFGMPVARFDYTQCENDRANIAFSKKTMHEIWETAGAQDVLTIDRSACSARWSTRSSGCCRAASARTSASRAKDISPYHRVNGYPPPDESYQELARGDFADYRLEVGGLVEQPLLLKLDELRALGWTTQITKHNCIQGWSNIAEWCGVPLAAILERCKPLPDARYLVFHALDDKTITENEGRYGYFYGTIPLYLALKPQSILALEMNGRPLPVEHGAPVRVRIETQLGFKMVKWVRSIELVRHYTDIGQGQGGWREDQQYYANAAGI